MWNTQPDGGASGLGNSPLDQSRRTRLLDAGIGNRRGVEQQLGVGMQRPLAQFVAIGGLHHAAEIHDDDARRDVPHHGEVVRDEEIGQAALALQCFQQIDDLPLDRHVERRHRLVADDELRLDRERARDADALALAAGELVRIAVGNFRTQSDLIQQGRDAFARGRAVRRETINLAAVRR